MDNTTKNIILDLLEGDQDINAYILIAANENNDARCLMSGTGAQLITLAISIVSQLIDSAAEEAHDKIKKDVKHYMRDDFVRTLNAILDKEDE